jgi:hypothetical protein
MMEEGYKIKINKLMIEFNNGRMVDSDFINSFMPKMNRKIKEGWELSDKERVIIDELFEKY